MIKDTFHDQMEIPVGLLNRPLMQSNVTVFVYIMVVQKLSRAKPLSFEDLSLRLCGFARKLNNNDSILIIRLSLSLFLDAN